MKNPKNRVGTDAVVTNDDAIRWLETLLEEPVDVLVDRLVTVEPAVAGLALRMASRTRGLLLSKGASPAIAAYAENQVVLSGVVCAQLIRLGNRQLWNDLIQPGENDEQPER